MESATIIDDPIKRMIWSLQPDNKARYPKRFKVVLDFLGLSKPTDDGYESLRKAAIEFVTQLKQNSELVEDKLMEFITSQQQRVESGEIKPITIRNYIKAVKTFCVMNKLSRYISWELIAKGLPSGRASSSDKAPSPEELRKLISDDLRLKVIVCIMSSCGFRIAAWNYLKVKHIVPIKKEDITLAQIKVYAGQNVGKRREYYSLISPEAYQTFQDYLSSRQAAGEVISGDSWVLRDKWQLTGRRPTGGNHGGGNYGLASAPKQLKASGVKSNIDDTLWKVGLRVTAAKHHEFKECHGFRKYFKTYAQRTMSSEFVERLLGHSGNWSDAAYNRPLDDWIIDSYMRAVPDLTIYKAETSEAVVQLTEQMESKDKKMQQLEEQMNKMQKDLQDIKEFELKRVRDPSYLRNKQRQEVFDEMNRTGKNLITVLGEKLHIDSLMTPKMDESIKKLPHNMRDVLVEKLIASAKRERRYEETHPLIKKLRGLLVDADVDTTDVITEEDILNYNLLKTRFDLASLEPTTRTIWG